MKAISFLFGFALIFLFLSLGRGEKDNRDPKPVTGFPFLLYDEVDTLKAINAWGDPGLWKALEWPPVPGKASIPMRLKWSQRISLKDADYVLCVFDSEGRAEPGNAPRVLILFTLGYRVKTWGSFTCEPGFEYGTIINPPGPETFFVTVNPSFRSGGELWFEKYRISPEKIEKLGEGFEHGLTKIKKS